MKSSIAAREGLAKLLRISIVSGATVVATWFQGASPTAVRAADDTKPDAAKLDAANPKAVIPLETWRGSMRKAQPPKKGFFVAAYPANEWHEVQPVEAPRRPFGPHRGVRPFVVGNGNNLSAQAPTGHIFSTTGSFSSVTGVTSESGQVNATGPAVANAYSIQLNMNFFPSTIPGGATGCMGWEQFVFANDGDSGGFQGAFIQYWLINFGPTSPAGGGWIQFGNDWFKNSSAIAVPNQPITNLANISLTGTVNAGGDGFVLEVGSTMYSGVGINAVNAAAGWTASEFIICGDGGGGQANFNSGASIVTKTTIEYGGTAAPVCLAQGFTAETNNLGFGPGSPGTSGVGPALLVKETSGGSTTASCSDASSEGDTHLTTLKGLFYDFQASGDFVLLEVGPDFVVQTRQVSGKPTWPLATVNEVVATQMGKTKVVISLPPQPVLTIDGKANDLGDGKSFSAPDGVDITRKGEVYHITSQGGNSVSATVHALTGATSWIDVSVGVGNCCTSATGLLAANGNANQIVARDGNVLTAPFVFHDLYTVFGDSWRVPAKESLLPGKNKEAGNPTKPFTAADLDPKVRATARAAALAAGVKGVTHLDAATLDIAVLNNQKAAHVFVGKLLPMALGIGGGGASEFAGHYDGSYSVAGASNGPSYGPMTFDVKADGHVTGTGKDEVSGEAYTIDAMLDESGYFKGEMTGTKNKLNLEGTAFKTHQNRLNGTLLRYTGATKSDGALNVDLGQ